VTIRRAVDADVPALVDLLVRAFDDDPVMNWLVRQDEGRAAGFHRFFEIAIRDVTLPHGQVFTTIDRSGVAAWAPPDRWRAGFLDQLRHLPDYVRVVGPRRFMRVMTAVSRLEARHPTAPHLYLFDLGVDPASRGRGIGSALLREMLDRCDHDGVPAYLENSKERNLPLYERHGFRTTESLLLEPAGPRVWLMWRPPRLR
jgi:ribosomal protein S18 acetylase RimI-like enzyme